jgi:ketosteroid isomerase-like protein
MTASVDPALVVRAVCDGVSRLVAGGLGQAEREDQVNSLAALYAEHTDVRHPFAPGGDTPLRTRADLYRHFAEAPGRAASAESFAPVGLQVHRTADPEVVISEFRYEGSAGGRPFSIPCAFVTRVRDGLIVESRDYADHVAFARAFGYVGALIADLAADAAAPA